MGRFIYTHEYHNPLRPQPRCSKHRSWCALTVFVCKYDTTAGAMQRRANLRRVLDTATTIVVAFLKLQNLVRFFHVAVCLCCCTRTCCGYSRWRIFRTRSSQAPGSHPLYAAARSVYRTLRNTTMSRSATMCYSSLAAAAAVKGSPPIFKVECNGKVLEGSIWRGAAETQEYIFTCVYTAAVRYLQTVSCLSPKSIHAACTTA